MCSLKKKQLFYTWWNDDVIKQKKIGRYWQSCEKCASVFDDDDDAAVF